MASNVLSRVCVSTISSRSTSGLPAIHENCRRYASKMYGGVTKNQGPRNPKKNYYKGIQKDDGTFVTSGTVLVKQTGVRYYPGENVTIGKRHNINAAIDGQVMITREVLNPYPDSPIYPAVKNGEIIERVFIHVLPYPQHNRFKLTSLS